ncbi:type II toxin-antitoxin system VapC family toxin [Sphingomonas sp. AR_OL41]|jgi:PIN domain nuclease of toxin-antitoxin system|uniref:type II toxin-antitoxin system VapC family toxin n=1 Tax=Sphingomonas sp. AR_OL41 TaxID=3042729 RepID=UPI0024801628|nr:type II toxin-antitoxin system VapC family toxin [Sphingomonas sp. AR_OL41]MDH7975044.1 type II toxin-antitoxin system VapC family toxin [Sphingomonas sp. AR_OL41]
MSDVRYVLDASALLAAILGERGARTVEAHFADACISAVNLSEVVAKLSERGVPDESIHESLSDLDLDVRDFDTAQALRAGALRNLTRSKGLSLGDRACLALAGELDAVALTTDAAWVDIAHGVAIELAR